MGEVVTARFSDPGSIPGASIQFKQEKSSCSGFSESMSFYYFDLGTRQYKTPTIIRCISQLSVAI